MRSRPRIARGIACVRPPTAAMSRRRNDSGQADVKVRLEFKIQKSKCKTDERSLVWVFASCILHLSLHVRLRTRHTVINRPPNTVKPLNVTLAGNDAAVLRGGFCGNPS